MKTKQEKSKEPGLQVVKNIIKHRHNYTKLANDCLVLEKDLKVLELIIRKLHEEHQIFELLTYRGHYYILAGGNFIYITKQEYDLLKGALNIRKEK